MIGTRVVLIGRGIKCSQSFGKGRVVMRDAEKGKEITKKKGKKGAKTKEKTESKTSQTKG